MPRRPSVKIAAVSRDKLFWPALVTVIALQLLAFWMLCSDQVRKAEVRNATRHVQQVAVADCLRYIPQATLSSCIQRVDQNSSAPGATAGDDAAVVNRAGMSSPVPVNFSYR